MSRRKAAKSIMDKYIDDPATTMPVQIFAPQQPATTPGQTPTPQATIPTSAPAKKKASTKRKRGDWLEDTISKDEALERAAAIRDALDPAEDLQDFVVNGEEYESDEEASEKENEVPDDLSGMSIDLSNLPAKRVRKKTVRFKHEFEDMMNAKYEKMRQQRLAKEAAAMEVDEEEDEDEVAENEPGEEGEETKPKKEEDDDEDEDDVEEPDGDDCEEEPFEDEEEEESDYVPSDKEDEEEAEVEGDDEEEEQPKAKAGRKRKMVIE